jgi:hypothetical protein
MADIACAPVDLADALYRVGQTDRHIESHQRDTVPAHLVGLGTQTDRHGQVQLVDCGAVLFVIPTQTAGQRRDEGVIERTASAVGRLA